MLLRNVSSPDMADYLTVDDSKPAILLLFHLSKCGRDLVKFSLSRVVTIQGSLLVVALDCSVRPKTTPLS